MNPSLIATNATRVFGNGAGVFDLDLALLPGQILALVGLNGAGKSTPHARPPRDAATRQR